MAITQGTNILSYNVRMNLNNSNDSLQKIMEKLSSGSKINKAGDDAAGLVVSKNMETLIRGSEQAQLNIQNANAFLAIAEDGLVTVGEHLQRINDLLVNMANDTNDDFSRKAAIDEIIERLDEINRLADTTNFNGKKMLNGASDRIIIQIGADNTLDSTLDVTRTMSDCHTYADGLNIDLPKELDTTLHDGLTAKDTAGGDFKITGNLYEDTLAGKRIYYTAKASKDQLNPDYYEITNKEGGKSEITLYTYNENTQKYEAGTPKEVTTSTITAGENPDFLASNENCRAYMAVIQKAVTKIATNRGLLGAYENRMDSAYDAIATRIESLSGAKSVYTDTDVAKEATNMASQQIMQQVNTSLLASANTIPQIALSLIGA